MKKIISAVLALTVLLSMCACNGDMAENETSDVSSVPVISIDPSSMLSSDAPSSDIPSNEGSKPDENISSMISSEEMSSEERIPEDPPPAQIEEEIEIEEERIEKLLTNPGVAIGDNLYLLEWHEAIYPENCYYLFYRYDLVEKKMYLRSVISEDPGNKIIPQVKDYDITLKHCTVSSGEECISVEFYKEYEESYYFYLDPDEGRILAQNEYHKFITDDVEKPKIVATDLEDPVIGNGSFEVPATHPEYGKFVYETAVLIPDQNKAVIAYDIDNEGHSTVAVYDYDTNKFKKLLYVDEYIIGLEYRDGGYVLIDTCPYFDGEGWYVNQTLYAYNVATGKIKKIPATPAVGWDLFYWTEEAFSNGVMRWNEYRYERKDGVYKGKCVEYAYDVEKDVKYELLSFEMTTDDYFYPLESRIFTESAVFVKKAGNNGLAPLYCCAPNKTISISETVLRHHVCEDQGYVMYYEEQEDGSFEWKYYNF